MKPVLTAACAVLAIAAGATARASLPAPPAEISALPVSMLYDAGSGQVLEAHRVDQPFLPASITKVMTAYVAFEEIRRGRLKLDQIVTVDAATAALWNGRGTSMYLRAGETVPVDMLLRGIATASANDASVVLAQSHAGSVPAWTALMNAEARRLGMRESRFSTPNGWPDEGATYVSARDLVKLGEALIERHPDLYRRYFGQKRMDWNGVTLTSHDPTVGVVPGADGIKTGHTNEAGYNFLGSARRDGRRLIMVIGGAKTEAERAAAARALLEWGFSAWRARPLFAAGKAVAQARVQDGDARQVPLVARGPLYAAIPVQGEAPVRVTVSYRGPLVAPIAEGAEVARMEIRVEGMAPGVVPLYAGKAVGKAGLLDRLVNGIAGWFA